MAAAVSRGDLCAGVVASEVLRDSFCAIGEDDSCGECAIRVLRRGVSMAVSSSESTPSLSTPLPPAPVSSCVVMIRRGLRWVSSSSRTSSSWVWTIRRPLCLLPVDGGGFVDVKDRSGVLPLPDGELSSSWSLPSPPSSVVLPSAVLPRRSSRRRRGVAVGEEALAGAD